ncbi:MAG: RNA polymerase subunit sigma-70 [Planctomycetes bacterium]|nr:RNA polymerase subunit sigma-70 [Planctomycetota bacterium]
MEPQSVTRILERAAAGHPSGAELLIPVVYEELRRLARAYMRRERADHTLQPTALVNEACASLLASEGLTWEGRAHFFAIASRAMRRVLATHARDRRAAKRTPDGVRVDMSDAITWAASTVDMIALDDTLQKLERLNPEHAEMVELRYFGGLSIDEMSVVLGFPKRTIERRWRAVQAWIARELQAEGS